MKSKIFGYIFGTARPAAGGGACRPAAPNWPRLAAWRVTPWRLAATAAAPGAGGARRALPARAQSGTWQISIGISYYALSLVGETSTKG